MTSHLTALDLVAEELQQVEMKMAEAPDMFPPLANALDSLLGSGGKRLRPAVALLAAKFHPPDPAKLISLAAAVEMLHSATLVHDDVIDGSLLRRGLPTLNATWSRSATVLAGDFFFARAAAFAAETEHVRVVKLFAQTLMTICDGELRQLFDIGNWNQSKDTYYQRIYGKTAVLFATAAEAAAVLGNSPEPAIANLRSYGYNLGMAFQIMDDILDFVGDQQVMGKPVGSDLRQGTVTLPVFHYLQSEPDALRKLQGGNGHSSDEALTQLITKIRQSPAIEATRQEAGKFVAEAKAALTFLPDNVYRDALLSLADYIVERPF